MNKLLLALGASLAVLLASGFSTQDKPVTPPAVQARPATPKDWEITRAQKPSYPAMKCPVCNEELGKAPVDNIYGTRLVRTCCADCATKIDAATVKKIDDAVIAAQKANYPLTLCAMSDQKLDDKAVDYVHGTRLVRLANRNTVAAFQRNPGPAMAKLDKAYIEAQKKTYKLKNCPMSDEDLTDKADAVDYLYGTTLVRFCCTNCAKQFVKDPDPVMKKVAEANAAK